MGIWVAELQTAGHERKPYAALFVWGFGLRIVAIDTRKGDFAITIAQTNVDETLPHGRNTVFEGIFDQGNEHMRRDAQSFEVLGVNVYDNFDMIRLTELHQRHIAQNELGFLFEAHTVALLLIELIAQHFGQRENGTLRLGGVERREGIDIIERIEQKVGRSVRFKVDEFGLGSFQISGLSYAVDLVPPNGESCGHRRANGKGKTQQIAEEIGNPKAETQYPFAHLWHCDNVALTVVGAVLIGKDAKNMGIEGYFKNCGHQE